MFQAAQNRQPHTLEQREESTKGQQTQATKGPSLWRDPEKAAKALGFFYVLSIGYLEPFRCASWYLNKSRVEQSHFEK